MTCKVSVEKLSLYIGSISWYYIKSPAHVVCVKWGQLVCTPLFKFRSPTFWRFVSNMPNTPLRVNKHHVPFFKYKFRDATTKDTKSKSA